MWHYKVIDKIENKVVLDSSLRDDFYGFSSENVAYMKGLGSKVENRLPDYCIVETFEVIPDCVLSSFESSQEITER